LGFGAVLVSPARLALRTELVRSAFLEKLLERMLCKEGP
jgi:hypothetical protein